MPISCGRERGVRGGTVGRSSSRIAGAAYK